MKERKKKADPKLWNKIVCRANLKEEAEKLQEKVGVKATIHLDEQAPFGLMYYINGRGKVFTYIYSEVE